MWLALRSAAGRRVDSTFSPSGRLPIWTFSENGRRTRNACNQSEDHLIIRPAGRFHGLGPLTVAALVSLAACGGGGGSDDGGSATPDAAPLISEQNATAIVVEAYGQSEMLYSNSRSTLETLAKSDDTNPKAQLGLVRFAVDRMLAIGAVSGANAQAAIELVQKDAMTCPDGGSASENINDADHSGSLSTGDTGSLTFSNCAVDGVVFNGSIGFSNLVVTGSSATPARSIGAQFVFDRFSGLADGEALTINGSLSIHASVTAVAPIVYDMTLSGDRLEVSSSTGENAALSAFSGTVILNLTEGRFGHALGFGLAGTGVPGVVTVATSTPFIGTIGAYPTVGQLVVRAADRSAVRLSANSSTSVSIDVDLNGDGAYDTSRTTTWSELEAL